MAFEITSPISQVYVCHCSICRKATGTNGIAVVVVDNSAFHWVRGQENIATWKKPDADWQKWFCSTCASPLPGENDELRMYIPAGLITEGDENLKVAHHIWVDSKAQWDEIGDSGKLHPEAFGS
ncbi:GFA family protein [Ferrimonas sp.]|uniref:GFA family protein n=1 Tax=Ferrimonas sp. TaxID=2080861 RepID=UPI003A919DB0